MELAAHLGLPYAFAHFITDGQGAAEAIALYRSGFKPSAITPQPHTALCVWALAADTQEQADRDYSGAELVRLNALRQGALVGTGAQVAAKLRALGEALEVDEIAVITWTNDAAVQQRSYTLLVQEFNEI